MVSEHIINYSYGDDIENSIYSIIIITCIKGTAVFECGQNMNNVN